jgi:multidrug efflux pump subunit AcrB
MSIAIFASTVTTVVVFLPIGLMGGLMGEFFLPFGIAVTYALSASFLVAITIVPALAYLFIRKEHLPEEKETGMQKAYTPILEKALRNKGATLAIAAVIFLGSLFILGTRPKAFLPDFGEVQISTSVALPDDTKMADTDSLVMKFEEALENIEGLSTVMVEIGGSGGMESLFMGGMINQSQASISIGIEDSERANEITALIREKAEEMFGKDYVTVSGGTMSSEGFGGFALVAAAEDQKALANFNDAAIETLNKVEGLANVKSNLGEENNYLRVDGEPAIRFMGELEVKNTIGVTNLAKQALLDSAPEDITISEGFESQMQTEGFANTFKAIGISIVIVYLVMVLTFGSFVHPFTILFSLPLAIIGAALALLITNSILGLSSMVGMMMLVGIVVTNAIVLIDRILTNKKERGMETQEALIEAGRTRLRPILMTAIAAILALVPLAIGLNEGAIIAAELAIVVIGGLTTSTLLTLIIAPVIFSILDKVGFKKKSA